MAYWFRSRLSTDLEIYLYEVDAILENFKRVSGVRFVGEFYDMIDITAYSKTEDVIYRSYEFNKDSYVDGVYRAIINATGSSDRLNRLSFKEMPLVDGKYTQKEYTYEGFVCLCGAMLLRAETSGVRGIKEKRSVSDTWAEWMRKHPEQAVLAMFDADKAFQYVMNGLK